MAFQEYPSPYDGGYDTVTIANGASLSGELALTGRVPVAILMPAAWTAANLTIVGSLTTAGTFVAMYDDAGTEYTVTAAASRWIALAPTAFLSFNFIKIRSGTAGVPVTQGGDRVVTVILRNID